MQPYFFSYIGYWQLLNAVDEYVVYDDVNYIKNGWINRNRILVNGEPSFFNLQLINASPNKKINEIKLNKSDYFTRKNIKTIELAYKKAPYFNDIFPLIVKILNDPTEQLSTYIYNSILSINDYLNINTKIIMSSQIEKNNDLKGQDKVIEICKKLKGTEYYNAIGGIELYDKAIFQENGIQLSFVQSNSIEYNQFNNDFVPYLSIIDVLMFNSRDQIYQMLNAYRLI